MKRLLLLAVLIILPLSLASANDKDKFHVLSPDALVLSDINTFIAPNVTTETGLPETTGLIVFDVNQNAFYGKGTVAGVTGWQPITPSAGSLVPSGIIMAYGGSTAPAGYVMCDGTSYLRSAQPNLFAAINTAYGAADSTHFNAPDLRGLFPRGTDSGAGNDPDTSSRTACNTGGATGDNVGSCQADQFASHTHSSPATALTAGTGAFRAYSENGDGGDNLNTTGGNETRPKNVYVNYIIKL